MKQSGREPTFRERAERGCARSGSCTFVAGRGAGLEAGPTARTHGGTRETQTEREPTCGSADAER